MIEVRKDGEGIKISFPYNPDYIAKIKTIEGYRWYPEEKCWSVPYFEFETLLSGFEGEKLVIDAAIYLDELKKELMLRKYSQRTIKQYLYHNREFTPCAIALQRIYLKVGWIYGTFKSYWGIRAVKQRRYIHL